MGIGVAELAVGGMILFAIVVVICKTIMDSNRPRPMVPMGFPVAGQRSAIPVIAGIGIMWILVTVGGVVLLLVRKQHTERAEFDAVNAAAVAHESAFERRLSPVDLPKLETELERERNRRAEAEARVTELEAKVAALEKNQPAEKPPAPVEELTDRHLHVGEKLDEARAKTLGLDDLALLAANRAIENEEKRLTEILQRLYAENVKNDADVYAMSAKELVLGLAMKMTPDIESLENLSPEARKKLESGATAIEDVLPKDAFLSRMAMEMHAARQKTYEELGRSLTPEQVEAIRKTTLGEGSFSWPGGVNFDLGPAPAALKK